MNTNQSPVQGEETPNIVKALAWGTILVISVPQIIYRVLVPPVPGEPLIPIWLVLMDAIALAVLWVITWIWSAVKSLRGYFLALFAFWVGIYLILPSLEESAVWSNWVSQDSWGVRLILERFWTHFVAVVLMTLTLIGSGIGRQELFLVRGDPGAHAQPSRLLLMKESEPWPHILRNFLLVYVIIAVVILGMQLRPDLSEISRALIFMPAIVIAAAINAFAEEFELRSVPLARLLPVLGKQQSIMLTAVLFGLLHYFGNPGGLPGVLMVWYLGFIAAKSMIETRGFVWAFLIHLIGDIIIYSFWAMSALR